MRDITIFLIEENPELREMLVSAFPLLGPFQVVGVANRGVGFPTLQELHPDCVIVDLRRPDQMSQFVNALRSEPLFAQMALILLLDHPRDRELLLTLAAETDLVLLKPVLPSDLAQAIERLVARREDDYRSMIDEIANGEAKNGI